MFSCHRFCTVIQYVYNYIHVHGTFFEKDGIIYSTASPGQTEWLSAVSFCITITSLIQNKTCFLSNNSCSFKFYFQKIKLNNISIYKRQFFLVFSYKISLKIYCHLVVMRPLPIPSKPNLLRKIVSMWILCLQSSP